jgi:DNA uptake protein ComE-like DNA-binding protein
MKRREGRTISAPMLAATLMALVELLTFPAPGMAQVGKVVDANAAPESELVQLPSMTVAIASGMVARRPFRSVVDLNKFLLEQKLMPDQIKAFYGKAFVPINLNTGTREEFMLIPGVGSRMAAEFAEYRPWKSWAQFDKEIGKYVGQEQADKFKPYVFIPGI